MKLKERKLPSGLESLYREGEDGKDYVYFKSKKHRVIIRDLFEKDAASFYNTMVPAEEQCTGKLKRECIEYLKRSISKREREEGKDYTLVITTISDKILGSIDVYPNVADATLQINVKKGTSNKLREEIILALQEMHQKFYWYDDLYAADANLDGEVENKKKYLIASIDNYI